MKRNGWILAWGLFLLVSCQKEKPEAVRTSGEGEISQLPYDTAAVDSFAPGATPRNVLFGRSEAIVSDSSVGRRETTSVPKTATGKKDSLRR
ncbi:hypothetical protein [Bergeyella sp. RCAD1439]|uniref:hypothetical protein n=1 Tax=Bergeyella anatis TaxID=3113737 RepID=UPI002E19B5F5|nr:hypothetical protein [Bergeyella sp. RCAD1439]